MRIIDVYPADDMNGDGLRVVAFFAGCKWNCKNCFNPQTHDFEAGEYFDREREAALFDLVDNDYISGITFTGGDPLFGGSEFIDIVLRFRERFGDSKTIWVYTGFEYNDILRDDVLCSLIYLVDVLCVGKFIEARKFPKKQWVGSNNQEVIYLRDIHK